MSHTFLFIYLGGEGKKLKKLPSLTERAIEAMISGSKLVKAPHCWGSWGRGIGQMEGELPQNPHAPDLLSCTCLKS